MTEQKRCVCGRPIEDMLAEGNAELPPKDQVHHWRHTGFGPGCTDPRPGGQDGVNREAHERLSADMQKMRTALNNAEGRFHDLVAVISQATDALADLGRILEAVRRERRATLNQAWDKLVEQGDMVGAGVVRDMIKAHDKGDWS